MWPPSVGVFNWLDHTSLMWRFLPLSMPMMYRPRSSDQATS